MRLLLVIPIALFLLVRGILRLLFVPLHDVLLKVSLHLGPARFPFLLLCSPIIIPGILLAAGEGRGRVLEGDVIRPTFSLPYAFARGAWRVVEEQTVKRVLLELGTSTLEVTIGAPLQRLRTDDVFTARIIDQALARPRRENGMRWAGARVHTFTDQLTCLYMVWSDDAPEAKTITVKFVGRYEDEPAADAFVDSVMPALPEEPDTADEAGAPAR